MANTLPLSLYGAIATAHARGVHLTAAGFRSKVSRGEAPEPVMRVGRQPLWDRADIEKWAKPRDGRRQSEPTRPGSLALRAEHLLDLPEDISDAERARAALLQLPERIRELEMLAAVHHGRYERAVEQSMTPGTGSSTRASLLQWIRESRTTRQAQTLSETYLAREMQAREDLERARTDVATARAWLSESLAWLDWAQRDLQAREDHTSFDEMLTKLTNTHAPATHDLIPILTWVLEDERRIAYLLGQDQWPDLTQTERAHLDPRKITLAGADFSYNWQVPGFRASMARLSWIEATGEMYFEQAPRADRPIVLPVAVIPGRPSLRVVIDWMEPFEALSKQPGAFGLLAAEIQVQTSAGWPGLTEFHLLEPR